MIRARVCCSLIFAVLIAYVVLVSTPSNQVSAGQVSGPQAEKSPPKNLKIDPSKAIEVPLPQPKAALQPAAFTTKDGKTGWVVQIPGGRPIATPACADGLLFLGGGYGSHEFYAFEAESGNLRWKVNTSDDGPSAAVVEGGYVCTPLSSR